jgi:hypothetical protein
MCCIEDNVSFFRIYNTVFALINLAFLIASMVTFLQVHDSSRPYYRMYLTHNQEAEVYPLYIIIGMNVAGVLFHSCFAFFASSIVNNSFQERNSNPYRCFLQFVGEGAGLVGIMVIHGIAHVETLGVVLVIFGSVLTLCYFQDEYLNTNYEFTPNKEPHFFAIPIYILLIIFVTIKSTENIKGPFGARVAIVSLIGLFQTSFMFIIQRMHISKRFSGSRVQTQTLDDDDVESDGDGQEDGGAASMKDQMDAIEVGLAEIRRGIFYEILQYTNTTVFMMVVSWLIISIVRNDVVLHEDEN